MKKNLDIITVFDITNKKLNLLETFINQLYDQLLIKYKEKQKEESKLVKSLGGLYVIGTERHESRRIDNQFVGVLGDKVTLEALNFF